ncbi:hypothetical protein BOTBODRAFT_172522 [Botryobasidium botryosum FD-172 SS1]|uniref:DUF676 domain-containing protein n=1 Tax=Botryobasidium botryosum (strain FD-172 SS1) TaxID=930990 RepID=A0A067MYF5_BOTB1|nr:hypothetical protein BOTBODRAFT_172522 [Botryobasidium botryosum FD-172 SS1]
MNALKDAAIARNQGNPTLRVICAASYPGTLSHDGIDVCAERVLCEIEDEIAYIQQDNLALTSFSIVGFSLGGLIARYLLGILETRHFFEDVRPVNFTTFASPAIGIPILPGMIPAVTRLAASGVLSRTGSQLYLRDHFHSGLPLVQLMASPESSFYQALCRFRRVEVYTNIVKDAVVPYMTGGIDEVDMFAPAYAKAKAVAARPPVDMKDGGLDITFDSNYPCIVASVKEVQPPTHKRRLHFPHIPNPLPLFNPQRYEFMTFPLNYLLVALVPLGVLPAVGLALGDLGGQRIASEIRIARFHPNESKRRERVGLSGPEATEEASQLNAEWHHHSANGSQAGTKTSSSALTDPVPLTADLAGVYNPVVESTPETGTSLPESQRNMIASLNSIPQMRKHLVYLDTAGFTSHPIMICQDTRDAEQRRGLDVVRHWADGFVF